jgi:hypothetical protein
MTIRPALTRCASTVLCCALLAAPMTAQASPLVFWMARAVTTVAPKIPALESILESVSLPLICILTGGSDIKKAE